MSTKEITYKDIRIDPDFELLSENRSCYISAYIETWFDVDAKFGTQTRDRDDAWVNLYAIYNPVNRTLRLEYFVDTDETVLGPYDYKPTESEKAVFIEMIERKCKETEGCSCKELLDKKLPMVESEMQPIDWFYMICGKLRDYSDGDVWSDGAEILCKTESAANTLADMLEQLYKLQDQNVIINTGYYDPEEDKRNQEEDRYTGWWYVNIE